MNGVLSPYGVKGDPFYSGSEERPIVPSLGLWDIRGRREGTEELGPRRHLYTVHSRYGPVNRHYSFP